MRTAGLLMVSVLVAACAQSAQTSRSAPRTDLLERFRNVNQLPGAPLSGASANPATDRCYVAWRTITPGAGTPDLESAWLVDAPASRWINSDMIHSSDAGVVIFVMVNSTNGYAEAQELAVPDAAGVFKLSTQTLAQGGDVHLNVDTNMDLFHFSLGTNGGVTTTVAGNGGAGSFGGTWSYSQYAEPHLYGGTGSGSLLADFGGNSISFGTSDSIAACYTPL